MSKSNHSNVIQKGTTELRVLTCCSVRTVCVGSVDWADSVGSTDKSAGSFHHSATIFSLLPELHFAAMMLLFFISAVICLWLNLGLPPQFPPVLWCH